MVSEMNFVHHISKVFRGFGGGYFSAITHTMVHELGHGVYKLQHTFAYKQLAETKGKTDNLMDYNGGSFLAHYQWRVMQDSVMFVWKVLQDDEDAMHSDSDCKNVWLTRCAVTSLSSVVENHLGLFEELHHTFGKNYAHETSYGKSISIDNFPDWTAIGRDNIDYMEQIHENEDDSVILSDLKKGNVYVDFVLKSERRELNTIFKGWTIYIYAFKDKPTLSGYKIHKNSEYETNSRVKVLYKDCLGGDVFVCFFDEDGALEVVFQLDYFSISSSSCRIMRGKEKAEYWRDYLLNSYIYNWTEELQEEKPLQERFMPIDRYIVSVNDATIRKSEDRTKFENKNIPMGTEVVIESESEVNGKVVAYVKLVDSDPELFYYTTKSNLTKIEVLEKPEDAGFIFGNSVKLPYSIAPTGETHDLKDEFEIIARCGDYIRIASSSLEEFGKNSEGFWINSKNITLTVSEIAEIRAEIAKMPTNTAEEKAAKEQAYLDLQWVVPYQNQRSLETMNIETIKMIEKKDSEGNVVKDENGDVIFVLEHKQHDSMKGTATRTYTTESGEKFSVFESNTLSSGYATVGDVMCNLTSLAMGMEYLGVENKCAGKQYADCINQTAYDNGIFKSNTDFADQHSKRKSVESRKQMAEHWGVEQNSLDEKKTNESYESFKARILPHLKEGAAIYFSMGSHVVRLVALYDDYMVVDDPYGCLCSDESLKKRSRYRKGVYCNNSRKMDCCSHNKAYDANCSTNSRSQSANKGRHCKWSKSGVNKITIYNICKLTLKQ